MTPSLASLGWNSELDTDFLPLAARGLSPARVCGEHRGEVDLFAGGARCRAYVRGTLLGGPDAPGIGDWVGVRLSDDPAMPAMVEAVLPRRTQFSRKAAGTTSERQLIAANIDTVFVATSLNSDLNLRRIERYLAAVTAGGARAVVVLTKADLVDEAASIRDQIPAEHVVVVSALRGAGLADLAPWCGAGQTVALVGTSGVGKSTLVNALLGREAQDTGGIRERDERGKHTTTARVLLPLPGGGCLIDTPGMRELGLLDGAEALDQVYQDIIGLADQCGFRDCRHVDEPNCAVLQAVDLGVLAEGRLHGYRKLQREIAAEGRRHDARAQRAFGREWGRKIRAAEKVRKRAKGID